MKPFQLKRAISAVLSLGLLRRDRFRTMVNVMGDALATGIMAHICRKDFVKEGEQVRLNETNCSVDSETANYSFNDCDRRKYPTSD